MEGAAGADRLTLFRRGDASQTYSMKEVRKMLVLTIFDGDALEFTFKPAGEMRRVWCKGLDKGQMMLHERVPGSPFLYKQIATLTPDGFREVWPGVRLRYFPNPKGVWKVGFDLDDSVAVERKPARPKVA
jgi:hypothetical protein